MRIPPARRIVLFVVSLVVAGVCVRLGIWQLDRLDERRALNAEIEAGLAEAPISLTELLDAAGNGDDLAYRRVVASGTYDVANELVLYGRPLDGSPGDHVLTPLVTDDGPVVLVDRGWIPAEPNRDAPVGPPAAAPDGDVRIEGVMLPTEEGAAFTGDDQEATLVRAVNVPEIDDRLGGYGLASSYLLLQAQSPAQPQDLPVPAGVPEPTEGPHLSYAIQWFSFATIAIVGYVVLARRDRRDDRNGVDAVGGG